MTLQGEAKPPAAAAAEADIRPGGRLAVDAGALADGRQRARAVSRVVRAMDEDIARPTSNGEMAELACLSEYHFNRVFREATGIPPVQFLYAMRLQRAKELLLSSDWRVTDICFEVGYNSFGSFVSRFSELVGMCPTSFRRLARRIGGLQVGDLLPQLPGPPPAPQHCRRPIVTGEIACPQRFDGIVFTGLFARAIPEGRPISCSLTAASQAYALPVPADGRFYALSFAAERSMDAVSLLNPTALLRGRSGMIGVRDGAWSGDTRIALAGPRLQDPPILAAVPLLLPALSRAEHAKGRAHPVAARLAGATAMAAAAAHRL